MDPLGRVFVAKIGGSAKNIEKKYDDAMKLIKVIERGKYQWQATFDAISDPVMIINKDMEIVRANRGTAIIADSDVKKIIGKKCYKVFADRKSTCDGCPHGQTLSKNEPATSSLECTIRDREYVVNSFPFANEDGSPAVVLHYRDVTEERRLQREVIQQEKMAAIGMLAGGVAHEINNPLGGIIAFSQLIKKDLKDEDPIKADISEIETAALRCKKIVQDLLDFSRISSGKVRACVQINDMLGKVLPFIKMELRSLNIRLKTCFDPDLPSIVGDANRLEQVFLNLMTNACQAMKKGGELKLSTKYDLKEQAVCIEVKDTGVGIPPGDLSKVFDPFFTTKRPGEGTGLGLSISYRIIRDHGGKINVVSIFGKGTTFNVCLPISGECLIRE